MDKAISEQTQPEQVQPEQSEQSEQSERYPKIKISDHISPTQVHENCTNIVMALMSDEKNMAVGFGQEGIDLFISPTGDDSKVYETKVIGRKMPTLDKESPTVTFEIEEANKLEKLAAGSGHEAAVAFVVIDEYEGEHKIRVFFTTLTILHALAKNARASFIGYGPKTGNFCLRIRQDENQNYIDDHFRGENADKWEGLIYYAEFPIDYISYAYEKCQIPF